MIKKTYLRRGLRRKRSNDDVPSPSSSPSKRTRLAATATDATLSSDPALRPLDDSDARSNVRSSPIPRSSSAMGLEPLFSDAVFRSTPASSPPPPSSPPAPSKLDAPLRPSCTTQPEAEAEDENDDLDDLFQSLKPKPTPPRRAVRDPLKTSKPKPARPKKLTQLTLSLGPASTKHCPECDMDYTPSNAGDAALHRKFHAKNVGGVDLSKRIVTRLQFNRCVSVEGGRAIIVVVDRRDTIAKRKAVDDVWTVAERELGGEGVLPFGWEQAEDMKKKKVLRCKAFLYIQGQKCVGFCLAQPITEGFAVLAQEGAQGQLLEEIGANFEGKSSSISVSKTPKPALLGISRIWTSAGSRGKGVATGLLNCATQNFIVGMKIPKEKVAFSQPTESGGKLARKWFGKESGWLVYIE